MKRISSLRPAPAPAFVLVPAILLTLWWSGCGGSGPIRDDAMQAGLTAEDFPEVAADLFAPMDQGIELSGAAIQGRNTWILWTGGSQVFLDWLAREGYGISDTLEMLDSRRRGSRFEDLGLNNEPGFETARAPDRYGLWLDVPASGAEFGEIDARIAAEGIPSTVYGRSTGVLGLRLFPNPDFDEAAAARWDADRFYDPDDDYSRDPALVRPYRVGMTCGLCHVAPNPLLPPADPNNPRWENLVSLLGNQYFREGRVFASNLGPPPAGSGEPSSFLWEMLEAQPPGTSDTSRMATDHINNPNAMNAISNVDARLAVARVNPESAEPASEASSYLPGIGDNEGFVPRILKDGADSVGLAGAALRVYVNIGTFSQYWLTLHKPIVGIRYQQPFEVAYAQQNSTYWRATEQRMANLAAFFRSVGSYRLRDAEWVDEHGVRRSGGELLTQDPDELRRGGVLFARNCAGCHSSKRPPDGIEPRTEAARRWFEEQVASDSFLAGNFLSEDKRHPITRIGTNACRAVATNAKRNRIWDNFSSESYKSLQAIDSITIYNPFTGRDNDYQWHLQAEHSLGYYRTPSLASLWTSAPFLHNNSVGLYNGDPSVEGRLQAFEDAAEKLLWPERREGVGSIWRTTRDSAIQIPAAYLPALVRRAAERSGLLETGESGVETLRIGPVPAGTPINLLASLDLSLGSLRDSKKAAALVELALEIRDALHAIEEQGLSSEQSFDFMKQHLLAGLIENSKCPDLVTDRGHTFGAELSEGDKRALIEFLKTL